MKKLIWYNPDTKMYQWGTGNEYKELRTGSRRKDGFTLLFKLDETNQALAGKIIRELNSARSDRKWETGIDML